MGMRKIELLLSSHTCNRIYVAKKITRLSLTVKLWVKEMATNDPLMIILSSFDIQMDTNIWKSRGKLVTFHKCAFSIETASGKGF